MAKRRKGSAKKFRLSARIDEQADKFCRAWSELPEWFRNLILCVLALIGNETMEFLAAWLWRIVQKG